MIGIVADDITGANDIGIMYAKAGIETYVYPMEAWKSSGKNNSVPEVLVLDTHSRLDEKEEAYRKVFEMTKALKKLNCKQYINKTCSVFRGNIGAELDAMMDALDESFAIVVLGFPKNGRVTLNHIHYVHGKLLEESEFRSDPIQPMLDSNLVDILQSQTKRKVDSIHVDTIEQGCRKLVEEINTKRNTCNYLILDVRNQDTLKIIAEAVSDEKILCGSSALSEELALLSEERDDKIAKEVVNDSIGNQVFCVAGSLMPQTAQQIAYVKDKGICSFELESLLLIDEKKRDSHIIEIVSHVCKHLESGEDVLLHTTGDADKITETKQLALMAGISNTEVSRLVSNSLSNAVQQVVTRTGQNKLLIAGGETSATVCKWLGVEGLQILSEIEPGLPTCRSLGSPAYDLVLKSGSFGSEAFFESAIKRLKEL